MPYNWYMSNKLYQKNLLWFQIEKYLFKLHFIFKYSPRRNSSTVLNVLSATKLILIYTFSQLLQRKQFYAHQKAQ